MRRLAIPSAVAAALTSLSAQGATISVDTSADDITDNGNCTLREAIMSANNNVATDNCTAGEGGGTHDTIDLSGIAGQTITLSSTLPTIAGRFNINGGGAVIDGADTFKVLNLRPEDDSSVTVDSLTVQNGVGSEGAGIDLDGNRTTLTLTNSTLRMNTASYQGGAILFSGTALIVDTATFAQNSAGSYGGAIYMKGGTFEITASTLVENEASIDGGAIFAEYNDESESLISRSTLTGNSSGGTGGAIYQRGPSTLTVRNSTLVGNTGGGIIILDDENRDLPSQLNVLGSIIAGSTDDSDCRSVVGAINPGSTIVLDSLIEDGSCGVSGSDPADGNLTGDPMLGALADNGGPTLTVLPQNGSPVIDAYEKDLGDLCRGESNDQRGFRRPAASDGMGTAYCDMGAVEITLEQNPTSIIVDSLGADDDGFCGAIADGLDCTLREAVSLATADSANPSIITFADAASLGVVGAQTMSFFENAATSGGNAALPRTYGSIDIEGPTDFDLTLDAGSTCSMDGSTGMNERRLVTTGGDSELTLSNLTITGGCADAGPGATQGLGGGILVYVRSTLTATNVTFSGNTAVYGGGIGTVYDASVELVESTLRDNEAQYHGGGVDAYDATVRLDRTTLASNTAYQNGGGLSVRNNDAHGVVVNSTVSGNSAGNEGGGVHGDDSALIDITNSTIATNKNGVYIGTSSTLTVNNSILADSVGNDCNTYVSSTATITDSLVEDGSCGVVDGMDGNLVADPMLGALADNGGSTLTHEPEDDSPVIDAVDASGGLCAGSNVDQRGFARPEEFDGVADNDCDMGAVERTLAQNPAAIEVNILSVDDDGICGRLEDGEDCSLREAVTLANEVPATDSAITFADAATLGVSAGGTTTIEFIEADNGINALPQITSTISITGPSDFDLVLDPTDRISCPSFRGNASGRRLTEVIGPGDLTLSRVTVSGGCADGFGGMSFGYAGRGGAVNVRLGGSLTLAQVTLADNGAGYGGGVAADQATVQISDSLITGSSNANLGGGLYFEDSTASITNSTIYGNSADYYGGGLLEYNSSVSILHSTIVANSGGNVYSGTGTVAIANSIIADAISGVDCVDATVTNSLIEDDTCNVVNGVDGNLTGDPGLGVLADNGGPTRSILPQPGSIVVDAFASAGGACGGLVEDQRGLGRPVDADGVSGNDCDMGAVELLNDLVDSTNDRFSVSEDSASLSNTDANGLATPADDSDNGVLVNDDPVDDEDGGATVTIFGGVAAGQILSLGSGATLTIESDGSFAFDGAGQYEELGDGDTDSEAIDYTATDGFTTDSATLIIDISGANDDPVASAGAFSVDEDAMVTGDFPASDIDEGDTLAFSFDTVDARFANNADGTFTFDAAQMEFQSLGSG